MKALDLFLPHILPHVLGASEPLVKQQLVRVAQEFCRRTLVVQEVSTVSLATGIGEYEVDVPSQTKLLRLQKVMVNNQPIRLVPTVHVTLPVALRGAVGSATPERGTPTCAYFATATGSAFWVYPLPDAASADALTAVAAYSPTLSATQLSDALYDDWIDALAAGTIGRLLSIKGQPFYSPAESVPHKGQFEVEVSRAKREALTGRVVGSMQVSSRGFA